MKVLSKPKFPVIDRIAFEKISDDRRLIVIADAYDGKYIVDAMDDFLTAAAGGNVERIRIQAGKKGNEPVKEMHVEAGGFADLVVYVGHNGLMDNTLPDVPAKLHEQNPKQAAVLACVSAKYFEQLLRRAGSEPLILTTGLMAPEAYTLDPILTGKLQGLTAKEIHEAVSQAYNKYQKTGISAARRLFTYPGKSTNLKRQKKR